MEINPHKDGIDHINVYSKGRTKIGRDLSNFAHTPFTHKKHGHFESVEGLWYYLVSGCQFEQLRKLHGFNAKKEGRECVNKIEWNENLTESEDFKEDIKEGIRQKLRENKNILKELCETNKLPLEHYYVYYSKKDENKYTIRKTGYPWIMEEIDRIRDVSNDYLDKKKRNFNM